MSDDATLLQQYLESHSETAFAALIGRHVNLVYAAALRQLDGDAHRAEDVTQSVCLLLARKARSLVGHPSLAGWLFTATRLVARGVRRSEARRRRREREAQTMHELDAPSHGPAGSDWERVRPLIDDAMAMLNARDRDAVVLRFFDGRHYSDIAGVFRISEDAARVRVDRALERLHAHLSRRGITTTAAALGLAMANHGAPPAPVGLASKVAMAVWAAETTATTLSPTGFVNLLKGAAPFGAAAVIALGVFATVHHRRARMASEREIEHLRSELRVADGRLGELESRVRVASAPASVLAPRSSVTQTTSMAAVPAPESSATAKLRLNASRHAAFVIDTSGSMRDPTTETLKLQVLLQLWDVLATNPQVEFLQILDADGRFILGRGSWLPNNPSTRNGLEAALMRYQIFSNSNPVPGIVRAVRSLLPSDDPGVTMSVVVLGDEIAGSGDTVTLDRLEQINPADAAGRRRVSINAIGFATRSVPQAGEKFASAMQQITTRHSGTFVAAPP